MKGSTVVITGAGFSRPAGGPLMGELFDPRFWVDERASWPGLARGIAEDFGRRSTGRPSYNFEDYFSDVWRDARTGGRIRFSDGVMEAEAWHRQLVTHLSSITSAIKLRRSTRLYAAYSDFIARLPGRSTTLISFNYDLLLEQLLGDAGISYSYGLPRPSDGPGHPRLAPEGRQMRLFKLHGSVNWLVCAGCRALASRPECVSVLETPYVPVQRKTCPSCQEKYAELGLVPPIYGKAGESRFLSEVWKKARAELREATRVIIIGYSMPGSDLEARSLMSELRARPEVPVLLVSGAGLAQHYADVVPQITDSAMYAERFFEHLRFASDHGSDAYRTRFKDAIPSFGRFYTPQVAS